MKRCAALLLLACLVFSLTACSGKENPVYVQSVSELSQLGGIAPTDRFNGLVVSESVTEVKKDEDKNVEELFVQEGQEVQEGQKLFAYDTEQLTLTLEKQRLELEQLEASIVNYGDQIAQLEKDRERANSADKLKYTLQIQTNQIDLKEAELKLKTKQSEVKKSEHLLDNAVVSSPVTGRVTAISESGTDDRGNPLPYITIQKTGSYRVKGVLNELQRGSIMEGDRILLTSRLDENETWTGTVSLVDYDNPVQGSNSMYMESDEMGNSSRYPFYVELDSSDGMLLGQHLYMTVTAAQEPATFEGIAIGGAFICYDEDGTAYVWADNGQGKLEKRTVELGMYDSMTDTQEILDGLTDSDFVAFPSELCQEGAPTSKVQSSREGGMNP